MRAAWRSNRSVPISWTCLQAVAPCSPAPPWRPAIRSVPQGESDVITLTTLASECYADLEAPNKELALIKDAGHIAAFTRPGRFLTELLTRVRRLVTKAQSSPECEP
jgi:hypothetical protein